MGFGHYHLCPQIEVRFGNNETFHRRHHWICYRLICDSPDVYACGLIADLISMGKTKRPRRKQERVKKNPWKAQYYED